MNYSVIDMETYQRKSHFDYFRKYANPYTGMTVNIDVSRLKNAASARGESFFIACLYAASRAANDVTELKQRILGNGIIEYDCCPTSHTVAHDDGTYSYCSMNSKEPYKDFIVTAKEKQRLARTGHGIPVDDDEREFIFVSCIPWESYTSIVQPTPYPADSNPRITFGKYFTSNGALLMPVTLLVNHALADGRHLAMFFEGFRNWCGQICDNGK